MNITEGWPKIKRTVIQEAAIPLLVILVGVGSFGLGRMSAMETTESRVSVLQPAVAAATFEGEAIPSGGEVVASKSGTKYHYPWCAGALQISEKNKIIFESSEKARAAGYLPAGNCKGLE